MMADLFDTNSMKPFSTVDINEYRICPSCSYSRIAARLVGVKSMKAAEAVAEKGPTCGGSLPHSK